MTQYNTKNELIKKRYEQYLELDERLSSQTVYGKIKDLRKYEEFTGFKCFSAFNAERGTTFKEHLKTSRNNSGETLDYATIWRTLKNLKEFLAWLTQQPGYRSKVKPAYLRVLNLSNKEENIAKRKDLGDAPTLEQARKAILAMPTHTLQERRNRAMVAFTLVTGVRVNALISLKICHVDEFRLLLKQNPKDVNTKFSKAIRTQFFPVGDDIHQIVLAWLKELKETLAFGQKDPLFPAMLSEFDPATGGFKQDKLSQNHITSTTTVREVFKQAWANAGMQYFNPHSFRSTLTQLGEQICQTPEQFKAWSQNLGHSSPLTTFTSYGDVHATRQCDLIKTMGSP